MSPTKIFPTLQGGNSLSLMPSAKHRDRQAWQPAELIMALCAGSGEALDAIYEMTAYCVTHGHPPSPQSRDLIEEVTTFILISIYDGALQRPAFLPDFVEIVARQFMRQGSPSNTPTAVHANLPKYPNGVRELGRRWVSEQRLTVRHSNAERDKLLRH